MKPFMGSTIMEYKTIDYPGSPVEGACFVRALVREDDVIVLAAQLQNYRGPSVTNSWEVIAPRVINKLREDVGLDHLASTRPWWKFWDRSGATRSEIYARTRWVEHYPPMTGLRLEGSISEVTLIPQISWRHTTKDDLARRFKVSQSFFDVL